MTASSCLYRARRDSASRRRYPARVAALSAVAFLTFFVTGCGGASTAAAPVTVVAVDASDAAALTLSTGQHIYDTGLSSGISMTAPLRGTCERIFNDTLARRVVAGTTVTAMSRVNPGASAPAGYEPARLTFAALESMDTVGMFSHPQVAARRADTCSGASAAPTTTTTTPAPVTTTSEAPTDVDVDVDVDSNDDGSSRYCRRHWFC